MHSSNVMRLMMDSFEKRTKKGCSKTREKVFNSIYSYLAPIIPTMQLGWCSMLLAVNVAWNC